MKPIIVNGQPNKAAIAEFVARVRSAARGIASRCGDDSTKLCTSINTLYQTALAELRPQFPLTRDDPKMRQRIHQTVRRIILIEAG